MSKKKEHQWAVKLRKRGKSYAEIKRVTKVSKGTLSAWLRTYPLSEARMRKLRDWNHARIEHYRATRMKKREKALRAIYQKEKVRLGKLSPRDIFIGGLFLYWGEGSKTRMTYLHVANTDPAVARAFIFWLKRSFGVAKDKIRIRIHLYKDMDIASELKFWSKTLGVDSKYFKRPYVKKSALADLSYKSGFGHGTCNVLLSNAMVAKRVLMSLRALRDLYLGQSFNGEDGALIKH